MKRRTIVSGIAAVIVITVAIALWPSGEAGAADYTHTGYITNPLDVNFYSVDLKAGDSLNASFISDPSDMITWLSGGSLSVKCFEGTPDGFATALPVPFAFASRAGKYCVAVYVSSYSTRTITYPVHYVLKISISRQTVTTALPTTTTTLVHVPGSQFPDVPVTYPYYAAINDLDSRGIISGKSDGKFHPDDSVTRQQFAKMIVLVGVSLGKYTVSENDVCPFTDVQVGGYGDPFFPDNYVAVCASKGITVGKTAAAFDPYGNITGYQVISMVVRAVDDLEPGALATPPVDWTGYPLWQYEPTHGQNGARAEYNGLLAGMDLRYVEPYLHMHRGEVAQVLYNLLHK